MYDATSSFFTVFNCATTEWYTRLAVFVDNCPMVCTACKILFSSADTGAIIRILQIRNISSIFLTRYLVGYL